MNKGELIASLMGLTDECEILARRRGENGKLVIEWIGGACYSIVNGEGVFYLSLASEYTNNPEAK